MNADNFAYWLSGLLQGKKSLTEDETTLVRELLSGVIAMNRPTRSETEKMVKTLFPELEKDEKKFVDFVQKLTNNK